MPLTIITKRSTLDVAADLDPPLYTMSVPVKYKLQEIYILNIRYFARYFSNKVRVIVISK